jgi:hypothetical protein
MDTAQLFQLWLDWREERGDVTLLRELEYYYPDSGLSEMVMEFIKREI